MNWVQSVRRQPHPLILFGRLTGDEYYYNQQYHLGTGFAVSGFGSKQQLGFLFLVQHRQQGRATIINATCLANSAMRECGSYHITVKGGKYLEALSLPK